MPVKIGVSVAVILGNKDAPFGGDADAVVETGNHKAPGGVDEPALAIVEPHTAVAVFKFVDMTVDGRNDDGAVNTTEAIKFSITQGFNAVNIANVTSTGGVALVEDVLSLGEMGKKKIRR